MSRGHKRLNTSQGPAQATEEQYNSLAGGAGNGAMQDILTDRAQRTRAIEKLGQWLATQRAALEGLEGAAKVQRAQSVLSTAESSWNALILGTSVDELELPATPAGGVGQELGVAMPPELIDDIRPIIAGLEQGPVTDASGGPEASASTGIDWNSRLGVPEYRTQSDNLVAPEATCNTTTLAMIMERLGMNRQDVVNALEERIKRKWIKAQKNAGKITAARASELRNNLALVDEEPGWDRDAEWKKSARRYLDSKMKDKSYRRVRGAPSVSGAKRDEIAGEMRGDAQMEDLLDMLAHEAGLSRYGIVSEPDKLLHEVDPKGLPAEGDKIWGGQPWKTIRDTTRSTIEAGGAAALSFHHKGTRDRGASHIVSVQSVQDSGFVIDDPYGEIRATYNPKKYDDAYFSSETYQQRQGGRMVTKEKIIHSRDARKNTKNGFDDWGAGAARTFSDNESKGDTTFITKDQITKGMKYITLFKRGGSVPIPSPRPER